MTTDCGPRWHWEEIEPSLQIASKSGLNLFNSTTFFYSSISVLDYTTFQFFDVDLPCLTCFGYWVEGNIGFDGEVRSPA